MLPGLVTGLWNPGILNTTAQSLERGQKLVKRLYLQPLHCLALLGPFQVSGGCWDAQNVADYRQNILKLLHVDFRDPDLGGHPLHVTKGQGAIVDPALVMAESTDSFTLAA